MKRKKIPCRFLSRCFFYHCCSNFFVGRSCDLPEERYHFPRTYLRQIEQAVGDRIIYYEPRRLSGELASNGGRQAYFAAARLVRIEKDPVRADHYYAFVVGYLELDRPALFREGRRSYEIAGKERMAKPTGERLVGRFGLSQITNTD